jgi:predicted GNAT family N-acyltransferase
MLQASLHIQVADFHSPLQRASIALRHQVLREPLGLTFSPEELEAENSQVHVVARYEDQLVGVLLLVPLNDNVWKMRQVATLPSLQGQGIGTQLVAFAEKWLKEQQAEKVELHARMTAVPFYLKMNYQTDENTFLEVGLPHWKMWKQF